MPRDDRILRETRATGAVLAPILLITGVVLYGWPGRTHQLFAWTIHPRMTPLVMGAGYLSGAYYHRHVAFYFWLILYAVLPAVFPLLWWRNRKTDPGVPEPGDLVVPVFVRIGLAVIALGAAAAAAAVFVHPQLAIDHWPWKVTPLTARVLAAWMAVPGVTGVAISLDRRWSSWRVPVEWAFLWAAGIGIGMLRARGDLIHGRKLTPVAVAFVPLWLVALADLYAYMTWRALGAERA